MSQAIEKVFVVETQVFTTAGGEHSYASADQVTAGVLAIFDESFANAGSASLDFEANTYPTVARWVLGQAGTHFLAAKVHKEADVVRVTKAAYRAPTANVWECENFTPAADDCDACSTLKYTVRVEDMSWIPEWETLTFTVEYEPDNVPADSGVVYADIATLINAANAEGNAPYTAAEAADVLTITADRAGLPLNVSMDDLLAGVAVVESTPADDGQGTYEQIRELEWKARGNYHDYYPSNVLGSNAGQTLYQSGNTPVHGTEDLYAVPFQAVEGETYDVYCLEIKNNMDPAINKSMTNSALYIAVNTDLTEANFETFLQSAAGVGVEFIGF